MLVNKVGLCISVANHNTANVSAQHSTFGFDMNKWITSRCRVRFKAQDIDVQLGFYDIFTWFLEICLDGLFSLGSVLLSLQVMWRKIFPISQQQLTNETTHLSPSQGCDSRSFTVRELRKYDGVQHSRIYFAVNGKVFDATNTGGIQFLDAPFSCLAGRDASRALATYSLNKHLNKEYEMDDLADLNPLQLDCLFHWEMQYPEMYPCVGRLVNSHQPRALQQVCIRTIRASLDKLNSVDELPLPKTLKNRLVCYG